MRRENFEDSKERVPSNCQNTQEVDVLAIKNKKISQNKDQNKGRVKTRERDRTRKGSVGGLTFSYLEL